MSLNKIQDDIKPAILEKLSKVIDPETGLDVIRMKLIQNLKVDSFGVVEYQFRPSSPLCPLAVPLAFSIIQAVREVPGVAAQNMTVIDYVQADQLNELIKIYLDEYSPGQDV